MQDVGLAIGDVNGDGSEDVVLADHDFEHDANLGMVHVLDGRTGAELWRAGGVRGEFRTGLGVAVVTDHVAEPLVVIASRTGANERLRLDLHRGASGALLCSFDLPPAYFESWCSLAPMDDLDHDGVAELAVGRRWYLPNQHNCGRVSVVSLRDGCELASLDSDSDRDLLGLAIACGQFDAEPGLDVVSSMHVADRRQSWLQLVWLSGSNLSEIRRTSERSAREIGRSIVAIGDLDGDGLDETLVGARTREDGDDAWHLDEALVCGARSSVTRFSDMTYVAEPLVLGALHTGPSRELRLVASSPRDSITSGKWTVFDTHGASIASHRDGGDPNDYYGVALSGCRVAGDPQDRLIVVTERQEPNIDHKHLCVGAECWGGANWATRMWVHELEPDAVRAR